MKRFAIIMKNNKELSKTNIMEILNVEYSFFYNIALEISDVFVQNTYLLGIEDIINEYCEWDKNENEPTQAEKIERLKQNSLLNDTNINDIINNNIKYYMGYINDDSDIKSTLCSLDIQYEDNNIKINEI